MDTIAMGLALGLIVSVPPGPNSILCLNLAADGIKRAAPLIAGAALTDAVYSLLAASGVLLSLQAGVGALAYLAPVFLIATAFLARSTNSLPARAGLAVTVLNPTTAAIWLGLSATPALRSPSLTELLLRPGLVAVGTAAWFLALATLAARVSIRLDASRTARIQQLLSALLAAAAGVSLIALLF